MAQKKTKNVPYPVSRSPLYRMRNKRKLAALLGITKKDFERLCSDSNYQEYETTQRKKKRTVQAPTKELKRVHRRLKTLFSRIETSDWLMSGKRRKSYVDNAKAHVDSKYLLNIDIQKFYDSSKREFVIDLFKRTFLMSDDVALGLAEFVTYKGFIPTGSPMSQLIAYWAYAPTFNRIKKISEIFGLKMTVYVDDLSFSSSERISSKLVYLVALELKVVGLKLKRKKTRFFNESDYKTVTGCVISTKGSLCVPNARRFDIRNGITSVKDVMTLPENERLKLLGQLESARQIEPNFYDGIYNKLRREKKHKRLDNHVGELRSG